MPDDVLEPDDELEAELAELRALGAHLEEGPVEWIEPPPGLWDRIDAAIQADAPAGPDAVDVDGGLDDAATAVVVEPEAERPRLTALPGGAAVPSDGLGVPAARRSPRRLPLALLAAAAVVLVVVGLLAVVGGGDDDDPGAVVASAPLDLLEGPAEGSAELVDRDGQLELHLTAAGLDPGDDAFYEVWVIDTEVAGMYSLGPLRADGVYDLPPGVDPEAFPIVDVSVEPLDGVPTHSGQSVLRGQLTF